MNMFEYVQRQNKWATRFMGVADMVAGWSKDPSTKVGAVLVKNNRIIATGYNGLPSGMNDDIIVDNWDNENYSKEWIRSYKNKHSVHAEINAIKYATQSVKGATLYITHPPCISCAQRLIDEGIGEIVIKESNDERFNKLWDTKSSANLFADEFIPYIILRNEKGK